MPLDDLARGNALQHAVTAVIATIAPTSVTAEEERTRRIAAVVARGTVEVDDVVSTIAALDGTVQNGRVSSKAFR